MPGQDIIKVFPPHGRDSGQGIASPGIHDFQPDVAGMTGVHVGAADGQKERSRDEG